MTTEQIAAAIAAFAANLANAADMRDRRAAVGYLADKLGSEAANQIAAIFGLPWATSSDPDIEENTMPPIKVQIDGTFYNVWINSVERDYTVDDLTSGTEYQVFYYGNEWHFRRYVKATRARRGGYVAISPRTSHKLCARLKQTVEKAESTFAAPEA